MSDNPIQQAVELAQGGKKKDAQRIMSGLLQQNPDNTDAWIVMAQLVDNDQMALDCWQQVLRLKPNDDKAKQRRGELQQKLRSSTSAQEVSASPLKNLASLEAPQSVKAPSEPETKKCPYCAETILAEAIKCKYCGSDLTLRSSLIEPSTVPASPIASAKTRPWYFSSGIKILMFLFLTPVWTLIVLADPQEKGIVKLVALIILLLYVLYVFPVLMRSI